MVRRSRSRLVQWGLAALLVLLGWPLIYSPTNAVASTLPTGFYLDVGGSSSLGYQPTGRLTKDGQLFDAPTNRGYADDLVKLEDQSVSLSLFRIGCPGETVATLLGEKDHCYKLPVTQMSIAQRILKAHFDDPGVVSIDIGFNDVQPCIETAVVEDECASAARQLVQEDLPKVVSELKSAAGPQVHFVGVEYGDPFLGRYLEGTSEHADATETLSEITELDQVLTSVYAKAWRRGGERRDDLLERVNDADGHGERRRGAQERRRHLRRHLHVPRVPLWSRRPSERCRLRSHRPGDVSCLTFKLVALGRASQRK